MKRFALIFFIVFALCLAGYQSFFEIAFELYLSHTAKQAGLAVDYTEIKIENGQVILKNPFIIASNKESLAAEQITLDYSFRPFSWSLELNIFIDKPHLTLEKRALHLEDLFKHFTNSSSWIAINGHLFTDDGVLFLKEEESSLAFSFTVNHFWGEAKNEAHYLLKSNESPSQNLFELFCNEKEGFIHSEEIDATLLNKLAHALFPSTQDFIFLSGHLKGELHFELDDWGIKDSEGNLQLKEVTFLHTPSRIKADIGELTLNSTLESKTLASLKFTGGTLHFRDDETYGLLKDLKGSIQILKNHDLTIQSDGIWSSAGKTSYAYLDFKVDLPLIEKTILKIQLYHYDTQKKSSQNKVLIEAYADKISSDDINIQLVLGNLREREFNFAERLLENIFPSLNPFHYDSGNLNANISLGLKAGALASVSASSIEAENIKFQYKPWELALGVKSMEGIFSFDLSTPNFNKSLNTALAILGGHIAFKNEDWSMWNFTDIETYLEIADGQLKPSTASVNLAGLKGRADIYGGSGSEIMHLHLNGKAQNLVPFLPEKYQKTVQESFEDDSITLKADLATISTGLAIQGIFQTISQKTMDSPPFSFGFFIEKAKQTQDTEVWNTVLTKEIKDFQDALLPSSHYFLDTLAHKEVRQNLGYSGFTLTHGWLKTTNLPLDKFVSSFLFPDNNLKLSGIVSLEATFDRTGFEMSYSGKEISLENERLIIELPNIDEHQGLGFYAIDFLSLEHRGFVSVSNGSYFDKDSGLLFSDIHSKIITEGEKIHFVDLETFSQGLYLAGGIDIDLSNLQDHYTIEVKAHSMEGTFSQAQHLLAHFDSCASITKIPLEGSLSFNHQGGELFFDIYPNAFSFQSSLDFHLMDGKLTSTNANLSLQDLELDIFYNHQENILKLSSLQGILLLGSPENVEEFLVESHQIIFNDFTNNAGNFDLTLKHKNHEFIKLTGVTQTFADKKDSIHIQFDLLETHLGSIYPQAFEIVVTDWNKIEYFQLRSEFQLAPFISDLRTLIPSKLSFIAQDLLQNEEIITKWGGNIKAYVYFDGKNETLGFSLESKNLVLNQLPIHQFHFNGYYRNERWVIEQLELDELSVATEFTHENEIWNIHFMGIRYGKGFLMGLEGYYKPHQTIIEAQINLFEVDSNKLPIHGFLDHLLPNKEIRGAFKGTGELNIAKQKKEWKLTLSIESTISNLQIQSYRFKDTSHVRFDYFLNKGWSIKDIDSGLTFQDSLKDISFKVASIDYLKEQDLITINDLKFDIPSSRFGWLTEQLANKFPRFFSEEICDQFIALKPGSALQGNITIAVNPMDKNVRLKLSDGNYSLFGTNHELKDIALERHNDEWIFTTQYKLNQQFLWLTTRFMDSSEQSGFQSGTILLSEPYPDAPKQEPLKIHWENDPQKGFLIKEALGSLNGLNFNLKENPTQLSTSYAHNLTGTIAIDGLKAQALLPKTLSDGINKLQIGQGYQFEGEFKVGKGTPPGEDRDLRFFGTLKGSEVELKGYRFKQILSQVIFEPGSLQFLNLTLSDIAGTFHIGNLKISKNQDEAWILSAPLMTAYDFRPSLLREVGKMDPKKRKPLVIRQLILQDLKGDFSDTSSFRGNGTLHFINPQKKNLQNTLFAIPAEILTRIGLNLSVLTPVQGNIHFEIQNDKFYLTKFKDVYSESKISKFYLPSSTTGSTIDFEGNLNVQVRFKQSTLLLKLAELFTINIKGTLLKPTYALQRQKYLMNQEVFSSNELELSNEN